MRKETLSETTPDNKILSGSGPKRKMENVSESTLEENTLDKLDLFGTRAGLIPRYSDDYEEFDDLERNEDTFVPETD
jgi:hypothetical protein